MRKKLGYFEEQKIIELTEMNKQIHFELNKLIKSLTN